MNKTSRLTKLNIWRIISKTELMYQAVTRQEKRYLMVMLIRLSFRVIRIQAMTITIPTQAMKNWLLNSEIFVHLGLHRVMLKLNWIGSLPSSTAPTIPPQTQVIWMKMMMLCQLMTLWTRSNLAQEETWAKSSDKMQISVPSNQLTPTVWFSRIWARIGGGRGRKIRLILLIKTSLKSSNASFASKTSKMQSFAPIVVNCAVKAVLLNGWGNRDSSVRIVETPFNATNWSPATVLFRKLLNIWMLLTKTYQKKIQLKIWVMGLLWRMEKKSVKIMEKSLITIVRRVKCLSAASALCLEATSIKITSACEWLKFTQNMSR